MDSLYGRKWVFTQKVPIGNFDPILNITADFLQTPSCYHDSCRKFQCPIISLLPITKMTITFQTTKIMSIKIEIGPNCSICFPYWIFIFSMLNCFCVLPIIHQVQFKLYIYRMLCFNLNLSNLSSILGKGCFFYQNTQTELWNYVFKWITTGFPLLLHLQLPHRLHRLPSSWVWNFVTAWPSVVTTQHARRLTLGTDFHSVKYVTLMTHASCPLMWG